MTTVKLGSCGIGMPYTQVKVVDPGSLKPVTTAASTGEFWVSGPNVSKGYWNNPEATAAVFTPDGWFRTGDIGYADEDGYLFIVDRLKDMVISGGENVYPAEIENVLNAHPGIEDVAVIGVPDERWGEAVCAVISFRGEELSLGDLREFLTGKVARPEPVRVPKRRGARRAVYRRRRTARRSQVHGARKHGGCRGVPDGDTFRLPTADRQPRGAGWSARSRAAESAGADALPQSVGSAFRLAPLAAPWCDGCSVERHSTGAPPTQTRNIPMVFPHAGTEESKEIHVPGHRNDRQPVCGHGKDRCHRR
jgi:hypothetical protein